MFSKKQVIEKVSLSSLDPKVKSSILKRIKILKDKGCWVISKDWSMYNGVHRKTYQAFVGPLISGKLICHKCDRPGCINPDHLFQGTDKDNRNDAIKKGRRYDASDSKEKYETLNELKEKDRWRQLKRFAGI